MVSDVDENLQLGHERVELLQLGILLQRLHRDGGEVAPSLEGIV